MSYQDISFTSQGTRCAAWLYAAAGSDKGTRPCIVMAHGFGAIKEMRLAAYAERFAAAGYHVLVFDYRGFGASEGEPRQLLSVSRQHEDWRTAIAFARTLPGVDANKIALWGTSFSGGHVIALASDDPKIAAVIAQVPHFDGIASVLALGPVKATRLTLHGLLDLAGSLFGRRHYVLSSGEPGELAIMSAPGESAGYLNLLPEGQAFERRVCAAIVLAVPLYSPGRRLHELAMPSLVQVGLNDVTTPPKPVLVACRTVPKCTLKEYACGHFQPYVAPLFETIIKDQLQFLATQL